MNTNKVNKGSISTRDILELATALSVRYGSDSDCCVVDAKDCVCIASFMVGLSGLLEVDELDRVHEQIEQ